MCLSVGVCGSSTIGTDLSSVLWYELSESFKKNIFPSNQYEGPRFIPAMLANRFVNSDWQYLKKYTLHIIAMTSHDLHRFTEMLYVPLLQHQRASSDITFFATGILCFVWST